jgi:hypothetical protein
VHGIPIDIVACFPFTPVNCLYPEHCFTILPYDMTKKLLALEIRISDTGTYRFNKRSGPDNGSQAMAQKQVAAGRLQLRQGAGQIRPAET